MTRRFGWLLSTAALSALAGCSAAGSASAPPHSGDQQRAALELKAHLVPCPAATDQPASDGLPNLTLNCLGAGPAVDLAALRGPAVVNVWGSWCGPCQKEAGYLSSVYDEERGKVVFLGIDTEDTASSALDFGTHVTPPVRYPSVEDPDRKVLIGLAKAPGPPETAFVGRSGRVVHVHEGGYDSAAELRSDIATYLGIT